MEFEEEDLLSQKKVAQLRRPRKLIFPRRAPSVITPPKVLHYPSPDKTTCAHCTCYPEEEPYTKPKKLKPCQHSPLSLYELAAAVVDALPPPPAFKWSVEDVVTWCEEELQLPQYKECFEVNQIDGMRLVMLEDPSLLPEMNIHYFEHIKIITSHVRALYGLDFVRFARSVGLPARRPLAHCTRFRARTGPDPGVRRDWTRADILRWMKVLEPAPAHRDHWDLVWYEQPAFPSAHFARTARGGSQGRVPRHEAPASEADGGEYLVPRRFIIQADIPPAAQMIWMQRDPLEVAAMKEERKKRKDKKRTLAKAVSGGSRHLARVTTEGKRGAELLLARRRMPRAKFLA